MGDREGKYEDMSDREGKAKAYLAQHFVHLVASRRAHKQDGSPQLLLCSYSLAADIQKWTEHFGVQVGEEEVPHHHLKGNLVATTILYAPDQLLQWHQHQCGKQSHFLFSSLTRNRRWTTIAVDWSV